MFYKGIFCRIFDFTIFTLRIPRIIRSHYSTSVSHAVAVISRFRAWNFRTIRHRLIFDVRFRFFFNINFLDFEHFDSAVADLIDGFQPDNARTNGQNISALKRHRVIWVRSVCACLSCCRRLMDVETSTSMLSEDIAAVTVKTIAINVIVNGAFKGKNIGTGFGGVDPVCVNGHVICVTHGQCWWCCI